MTLKRIAIFVEGQTERIFLRKLIEEIGGTKNIFFDVKEVIKGGLLSSVKLTQSGLLDIGQHSHFVLIVDCHGDERVKSTLLEQRNSLSKKGYASILGLRDLYPTPLADIKKVEDKLSFMIPTAGTPTHMLLAVSEVEAWFVQEYSHYSRISPKLDYKKFPVDFGFDPVAACAETIENPAFFLNEIYKSVGMSYKKKKSSVERTVEVLDYAQLYLDLGGKLPRLRELIRHIDEFLS